MIRILFLILFILICTTGKTQQQVSMSEARIAAVNTMIYNRQMYSESDIDTVHLYISGIDTMLYEVKFNDNHSVLLSGSKACQPILGYNFSYDDETALDKFGEIPPGLQFMIQEYIDQIELCFANDTITLWHATDWANLMTYSKNGNEVNDVVEPLITTRWGQGQSNMCDIGGHFAPVAYNFYITEIGTACGLIWNNCPTGCVATAMAQIMNYWKHPVYNSDYGPHQFDWCNMSNDLCVISPNYTNERNAIAWLMRQCGIKANMNYCMEDECESGAYLSDARIALVNSFGYSNFAIIIKRALCLDSWSTFVRNDLNSSRPILYVGTKGLLDGGHAFICDGYRSDNTFHFNWGWNGSYNNYWLTLNSLTFEGCNFNYGQTAIFNLYPLNNVDYCDFSVSLEDYFSSVGSNYISVPKTFSVLESVSRSSGLNALYRTIPADSCIEYVAHKKVILRDGFTAEEGSHFTAYIDECEKCIEEDAGNDRVINKESINKTLPQEYASTNNENEIHIIPNPNNGTFYVSLAKTEAEIIGIRVMDVMGKTVYSDNKFKGGNVVLPNVKQGLYYVTVVFKNGAITEKIVIK